MQTRRMQKGGMNVEQKIISNYSPISAKAVEEDKLKAENIVMLAEEDIKRHKKSN